MKLNLPVMAVLIGIAGLFPVTGCRTLPHCATSPVTATVNMPNGDTIESRHVIEVNSEGFLYDLRKGHNRKLIKDEAQLKSYFNETIFASFQVSGKKKILLFVHGGLNDRAQGMEHFKSNYQEIMQGEYYPVYVIWPSGWKDTYFEHLLWVRQGVLAETKTEKTFSLLTTPYALLADLGRAVTRLPLVVANGMKSDFETVLPIRDSDGGAAVRQYQLLAKEGYQVAIGDDYSRFSDRTGRLASYLATLPAKHLIAACIDGFGQGAWNDMLRRTQEVYPARLDDRIVTKLQTTIPAVAAAAPVPADTDQLFSERQRKRQARYLAARLPQFINLLHDYKEQQPSFEVTLVGHSMGAIILNRVVRDAPMDFSSIVYLAAACSVADFSQSVLPYMKYHPATQFYSLSLHPVAEAGEWYTPLIDLPPRGSLLVWLDNFLTNPNSEQERMLGRWRNLYRTSPTGEPFIQEICDYDSGQMKQRLHFEGFSVGFGEKDQIRNNTWQWNERPLAKSIAGRCDNPLTHGEFSEMPYWKPEFWWQPERAGGLESKTGVRMQPQPGSGQPK